MKRIRFQSTDVAFTALVMALSMAAVSGADRSELIAFPATEARTVDAATMSSIYEEVKTPFKFGAVVVGEGTDPVDGPKVFRRGDHWYMIYVSFHDKVGYETHLACSDDLLQWEELGVILPFRGEGWDAWHGNDASALVDYHWDGIYALEAYEGRYWMSCIGGEEKGYETDPLSIGLASTDDPVAARAWERFAGNTILTGLQRDARSFEVTTLYTRSTIRVDPKLVGHPFVIFNNGKSPPDGHEAIGMAVSDDLREWRRFGATPVIDNQSESRWAISGNAQIVKIGGVWVMSYFGASWKPNAFDTFACSYDLINWTKWDGTHLVEPNEPLDEKSARKPCVLKHNGVVYHFYCAVGKQGRVIALATSKDMKPAAAAVSKS